MTESPCFLSLERNSRSALKLSTAMYYLFKACNMTLEQKSYFIYSMACCKIHATNKKKKITLLSTSHCCEKK
ncbi:conserved hypothetical protein [Trichinella spiralis]|uniref:hypothetical protein n=1 Tax=Trichinella spiralis TaxID=6334 RepID=UPI0001EFD5FD|nr:conserved hypothetical protein [Trichinella spiralis]